MNQDFFARQNSLVKLFFVVCTTIIVALAPPNKLIILFLVQTLFFLIEYKTILRWLLITIKLLPFFISILIISLVFDTPFDEQLILVGRIAFILMLSTYLISTSSIDIFLADTGRWSRHRFVNELRLFFVSTMFFIPMFLKLFEEKKSNFRNGFSILPEIIQESFRQIKTVEEKAVNSLHTSDRNFDLSSNLLLFLMIVLNSAILFY
jgi:hypothetical protein